MSGYQWLVLALCFLIVAADGMDVAIMGFVAPSILQEWGISRAAFGIVMSAAPFGLVFGALVAGPASDKVGRKKVLVLSVLAFAVLTLATSYARDVTELAVLRFLTGIGLGAAMPNTTTLLSEYVPEKRRSLMVTLMFTGFNLGSALVGFVAASIIPAYGWRTVLIIGGLVPLALVPLLIAFLPESARFLAVRGASKERIGRTLGRVCGTNFDAETQFISPEPPVQARTPVRLLISQGFGLMTVALWVTYFMGLMVIYLLTGWLPTLLKDAGLTVSQAASITALFQIGGTAGGVFVGWLMDKRAPTRVISLAYLGGALSVLALAGAGAMSAALGVLVALVGFCMSGAQTGLNAYAPSCYPTMARATGVSWMLGMGRFGSIFGSMIGGVVLGMGQGFATVLGLLAIPAALAAAAVLLSRRRAAV
ncbi:MFS transporter [Azohydromonas aeria]|uniref:MFS transporter n=1 Tax=Azohydromonas aeria TaxID=2590212 RepID=UPI0012F99EBC|nr:MFS transporter [Azohydromonas aeria]